MHLPPNAFAIVVRVPLAPGAAGFLSDARRYTPASVRSRIAPSPEA